MGRRGLHNEGSELLQNQLKGRIEIDFDTARRLFTPVVRPAHQSVRGGQVRIESLCARRASG